MAFIDELGALIDQRLTDENREKVAGALETYRLDRAARSKLSRDDRPFANELAALVDRHVVDESFDKVVLALDVESSRLDRAGPLVPRSDWRHPDYMKRPIANKKLRPRTKEGIQILKAMVREKTMTSVTARKLKRSPGAMRQKQLGSARKWQDLSGSEGPKGLVTTRHCQPGKR